MEAAAKTFPPPLPVKAAVHGASGVHPRMDDPHERQLKDQAALAISRLTPRTIVELIDEHMQRLDAKHVLQLVTASLDRMAPEALQKATTTALMRFGFEVAACDAEVAEVEGEALRAREKAAGWRSRLNVVANALSGCVGAEVER